MELFSCSVYWWQPAKLGNGVNRVNGAVLLQGVLVAACKTKQYGKWINVAVLADPCTPSPVH